MIFIPFSPKRFADQEFRIRLGDEMATLRVTYSTRSAHWFLTVGNEQGLQLKSLKLVPGYPAMREFRSSAPILGDFFVFPVGSQVTGLITYEGLGTDWGLYWATPSEVSEWEVLNGLV